MARRIAGAVAGAMLLVCASACSGSGASRPTDTAGTSSATTTVSKAAPLTIVVTDDDGIGAPGIDVLTTALRKMPDVDVHVVAPATNQSGSGDRTTPGGAKYKAGTTASGVEGTAVEGTPADTIGVALDDLGLKPDLVVSGINRGQNLGPLAQVSGTVGAALTAARRKVPAVAASAGFVEDADYANAARIVVDWIDANRAALTTHRTPTDVIVSFNVPQCTAGASHETVKVPLAKTIPKDPSPFTTDCSTSAKGAAPTNDVEALQQGYAAQSAIPVS